MYHQDNWHVTNGVGSVQHSPTTQAIANGHCDNLGTQICKNTSACSSD